MSCARPVSLVNGRLQAAVADREVQSKADRKVQSKCDQIVMVRGHRAMASAAMTAAVQLNVFAATNSDYTSITRRSQVICKIG